LTRILSCRPGPRRPAAAFHFNNVILIAHGVHRYEAYLRIFSSLLCRSGDCVRRDDVRDDGGNLHRSRAD
jgi:hypothetical protein